MLEDLMELRIDSVQRVLEVPDRDTNIVFYVDPSSIGNNLLLEDAFKFLLEDNTFVLLESSFIIGSLTSTNRELVLK